MSFSHLFQIQNWGEVEARFERLAVAPPSELIANVNIVPHCGDRWLVIRLADGQWEIPGGTLEPGEDVVQALRRELLEEAGASLIDHQVIGAWRCHSNATRPYRSHLPYPDFYRLVVTGTVQLVQAPTQPAGGEAISQVALLPLAEAVQVFLSCQRPDLAELYQFAAGHRI